MKKIKENLPLILIFVVIVLLIYDAKYYSEKAIEGFVTWFTYVLPSLFPFFFLSIILSKTKGLTSLSQKIGGIYSKVYNVPPISSYAIILSYISGYPIGAKLTQTLYENKFINTDNALTVSLLASTSGPIFIIGTIGGLILNNAIYGIIIYLSHILSSLIVGLIFRTKLANESSDKIMLNTSNVLSDAMYQSVISILIVGGYIAIFYVFVGMIERTKVLAFLTTILDSLFIKYGEDIGKSTISGLFEATQGIKRVSQNCGDTKISAIISCGLISFGGLSINAQNLTFLDNTGIKKSKYLLGKLLHLSISIIFCSLFLFIFC